VNNSGALDEEIEKKKRQKEKPYKLKIEVFGGMLHWVKKLGGLNIHVKGPPGGPIQTDAGKVHGSRRESAEKGKLGMESSSPIRPLKGA